jgi:predicted nicotinamide N-methyase
MSLTKFVITVEVPNCTSNETAIAEGASYLAYADMTDTIGYAPNFTGIEAIEKDENTFQVIYTADLRVFNDDELENLMSEFAIMNRVLSVEHNLTRQVSP